MLTSYVILSRLTVSDGLLLLRAFARDLLNNGTPPGPHCLLKLLRSRFTLQTTSTGAAQECKETMLQSAKRQRFSSPAGSAQEDSATAVYRLVNAKDEFSTLTKEYEERRGKRKLHGSVWTCHHCRFDWLAAMYGADVLTEETLYKHCVAPGVYRRCKVCTEDLEKWPEDAPDYPRTRTL